MTSVFRIMLLLAALICAACDFPTRSNSSGENRPSEAIATINGTDAYGPRIALLIGNTDYAKTSWRLKNPGNDVDLLEPALIQAGFEVHKLKNLNRDQMVQAFRDHSNRLSAAGPNSVGLVYFSGHGVQSQGLNYLIPIDLIANEEADVWGDAPRLQDLFDQLNRSKNAINFVLLDACRDNPLPSSVRSGGGGLTAPDKATGMLIAYATAPGQTAADGDGENSPYAAALAKNISASNDPAEVFFRKVATDVEDMTRGRQQPWVESGLRGRESFCFRGCIGPGIAPISGLESPTTSLGSGGMRRSFEGEVALRSSSALDRIEARASEWPGMVSFQVELKNQTRVHICGGTAISPDWILTAATCFENVMKTGEAWTFHEWNGEMTKFRPRGPVKAILGKDDLSSTDSSSVFDISEVVLHPDYVPGSGPLGNDVALVKLSRPYRGPTMPLSLLPDADRITPYGEMSEVAGFGQLEEDPTEPYANKAVSSDGSKVFGGSIKLTSTSIPTVPIDQCRASIARAMNADAEYLFPFDVSNSNICTGFKEGGTDACIGDMGGPLIKVDRFGSPYQIGIISWGIGCGRPDTPSVNMRVSSYAGWIQSVAGRLEGVPLSQVSKQTLGALDTVREIQKQFPSIGHVNLWLTSVSGEPTDRLRSGTKAELRIRMPINGKLVVLAYDPDGALHQLYPTSAKEWRSFDGEEIVIGPGDLFSGDWVAAPPFGKSALLAFVVPEDADLSFRFDGKVIDEIDTNYVLGIVRSGIARTEIGRQTTQPSNGGFAMGYVEYTIEP